VRIEPARRDHVHRGKGKDPRQPGKLEADPREILDIPEEKCERLPRPKDHFADWEESIRTGKLPVGDVEIGHRSATVCHLGNIALRTGRKIRWDPAAEKVLDDPEAAAMVSKAYREPWKLP